MDPELLKLQKEYLEKSVYDIMKELKTKQEEIKK